MLNMSRSVEIAQLMEMLRKFGLLHKTAELKGLQISTIDRLLEFKTMLTSYALFNTEEYEFLFNRIGKYQIEVMNDRMIPWLGSKSSFKNYNAQQLKQWTLKLLLKNLCKGDEYVYSINADWVIKREEENGLSYTSYKYKSKLESCFGHRFVIDNIKFTSDSFILPDSIKQQLNPTTFDKKLYDECCDIIWTLRHVGDIITGLVDKNMDYKKDTDCLKVICLDQLKTHSKLCNFLKQKIKNKLHQLDHNDIIVYAGLFWLNLLITILYEKARVAMRYGHQFHHSCKLLSKILIYSEYLCRIIDPNCMPLELMMTIIMSYMLMKSLQCWIMYKWKGLLVEWNPDEKSVSIVYKQYKSCKKFRCYDIKLMKRLSFAKLQKGIERKCNNIKCNKIKVRKNGKVFNKICGGSCRQKKKTYYCGRKCQYLDWIHSHRLHCSI